MASSHNSKLLLPSTNGHQSPPLQLESISSPQPEEDSFNPRQLLAIARRRWWLLAGVSLVVSCGVWLRLFTQPPVYREQFQLLVEPIAGEQELSQLSQMFGEGSSSNSGNGFSSGLDYPTQIQVLKSDQVMSPIYEDIEAKYPELGYDSLVNNVTINRVGETKLLEISYQDSDPEKVEYIVEQISQHYIQYSLEQQQTTQEQGLQFIEQQLPIVRQRVDKLQEKLQNFRQKHNFNPEVQGEQLSQSLSSVLQQQKVTKVELQETRALHTRQRNKLGVALSQAMSMVALSESPSYQRLLEQLKGVEIQLASESALLQSNSPTIRALEKKRENLLSSLQQEASAILGAGNVSSDVPKQAASPNPIRLQLTQGAIKTGNRIQALEARQQALAQAEEQIRSSMEQAARLARQYGDIQRELQVATGSLNRFLELREKLQVEKSQKAIPWQQISEIQQPQSPISPNVARGLLLGAVAGLLAGVGATFLAEKLDNKFHSPDELQDSTGLTLLGTIPFQKNPQKEFFAQGSSSNSSHYQFSPFLEAFRSLHANLSFMNPKEQMVRSLVISSSLPGEGKSNVAAYLAQVAAAMGQRVLLVDADLRRPQLHQIMSLPNTQGLSNIISAGLNLDDVVQRSQLEDNLYVLTSGPTPPDPTRLFSSEAMSRLVELARESFDLTIFDTPPLAGLADAKLLGTRTDGLAMVVGLGQADQSALPSVLKELKLSQTSVLGAIANRVKRHTTGSYEGYYRFYSSAHSNGNGQ
ncbi:MAG: protein tyrosine kinase [Cyanobacteria bacterium SW_4_48_29]|nr:MAG: protein tyrosine kinase [Cyanobacteria bacterium SW_4_48_29]